MLYVPDFHNYPVTFSGSKFSVHHYTKDGRSGDVVVHLGSAVILPFLDKEHIVFIKNERFAVGQTLIELPAGTLEPEEDPIDTAQRELEEETGYRAEVIKPLTSFFTTPGICNEVMHAFVATDLIKTAQKLDEGEKIRVEIIEVKKAIEMALNGQIHDGKTLATLLFYATKQFDDSIRRRG